ncbi:hypothetical protein, partial [uncultured Bacteroides sp.]|uniref:hypothetical protein n=1 Tax=uncultured Bacteroides sp. TaxID=162156 RepID=UPI002620E05B
MRKKIRCPHCGKIQFLDESYHYGNKIITILICLLFAIIVAMASSIIAIVFWGITIYLITTFNTR